MLLNMNQESTFSEQYKKKSALAKEKTNGIENTLIAQSYKLFC
jgi:hypothetical protein